MKILIACEFSGTVRDSFAMRGHDAWSCDLLPTKKPGNHIQGDARNAISGGGQWDILIGHPPCTYLNSAGMHWTKRGLRDPRLTDEAFDFFMELWNAPVERVCLENSIGVVSTRFRKPDQIIQPHQFGDDASKATCLWLRGLPKLKPTKHIPPRIVVKDGKEYKRWANQTDSGQNRLGPSDDRWALRSLTYPGIADAMASQWINN